MSKDRRLVVLHLACYFVFGAGITAGQDGPPPCEFRPWNSTDNGVGAEIDATREFASAMTVDKGCLYGGRVFVPFVNVGLTRTAAGPTSFELDVFLREADKGTGLPGPFRTPTNMVMATGITQFPVKTTIEFPTIPATDTNINNVLWGDYFYIGAAWHGATAQQVFVVVDETGPPGENPAYTGVNGEVPRTNVLDGNPNVNSLAMGANPVTFYGRYSNGDSVSSDAREPLPTSWAFRYRSADKMEGPATDLRFRDGQGGPVICEYLDIPSSFFDSCTMTPGQLDRLANGDIFAELDLGGASEERRVYSAATFLFVDGFESGDTTVWTASSR